MTKKKTTPLAILAFVMLLGTDSYAQSIAAQSVNCGGTTMKQNNGSLDFTVGELLVVNQTDNQGNTLNGGFTTGATLTTVTVQETDATVLEVKVFPNPSTDLIKIQINHSALEQIIVSITDLQGKELYIGNYTSMSKNIGVNTASYLAGSYILSLKNTNNQVLGSYKIIKE